MQWLKVKRTSKCKVEKRKGNGCLFLSQFFWPGWISFSYLSIFLSPPKCSVNECKPKSKKKRMLLKSVKCNMLFIHVALGNEQSIQIDCTWIQIWNFLAQINDGICICIIEHTLLYLYSTLLCHWESANVMSKQIEICICIVEHYPAVISISYPCCAIQNLQIFSPELVRLSILLL